MKILFVINNLYTSGNGLSTSVRRTIHALVDKGMDVRVLSSGESPAGEFPYYHLKDASIPLFSGLIQKQGYKFAKCDKKLIRQAVLWADVIHLEEPFSIQIAVCKIADKYDKPCVATYHLHPENLFASVKLENSKWFNGCTMLVWRNTVYNHCKIVQCPTGNVRSRLKRWHYKAALSVISNGIVSENLQSITKKSDKSGTIHILSVGRFSREKDQVTLLNAIKYSSHSDIIQLHFAGKGPTEKLLKKHACKLYRSGVLTKKPTFGFYSQKQLMELFAISDLYVHSAIFEVEGMSCMEAACTGIVPIIATGKLTATSQFANNEYSLYPARDARALAARIDYWIDHPQERIAQANLYMNLKTTYSFEETIAKTISMYKQALI